MRSVHSSTARRPYRSANEPATAARQPNRLLLLGLMTAAGWDYYAMEWWHYQLFDAGLYPLLGDADLPVSMMRGD